MQNKNLNNLAVDLSKVEMPTTLDKETLRAENELLQELLIAENKFKKENNQIRSFLPFFVEHLAKKNYRKPIQAEWIITNNRNLEIVRECSNCHCKTYYPITEKCNCRLSRYCEDCGAQMKGADNENS